MCLLTFYTRRIMPIDMAGAGDYRQLYFMNERIDRIFVCTCSRVSKKKRSYI